MSKNSLNRVMVIGNVGREPEIKYLPDGTSVSTLTVATTEFYGKTEKKERTEWHNVVFFGRLAEIANEYISKGSKIFIEGSLRTEKWERKDGSKGQATKIICSKLIMLDKRKSNKEPGDEQDGDIPF